MRSIYRIDEKKNTAFLPENPKEDLVVHGKIILKWTSKKWGVGGQDSVGSGQRRRDEIIRAG